MALCTQCACGVCISVHAHVQYRPIEIIVQPIVSSTCAARPAGYRYAKYAFLL